MAWVTQGRDRRPHRGASLGADVGVMMLRRMFKSEMAKVEAGEDPVGVVRAQHDVIDLPLEKYKFGRGAEVRAGVHRHGFQRYSPQADDLKKLHIKAWENRGES